MEIIWPTYSVGPEWKTIQGRKIPPPKIDENEFYLTHKEFKVTGKNFICMAKQTTRGNFGLNNDVRIRNIKSSGETERKKIKDKKYNDTEPIQSTEAVPGVTKYRTDSQESNEEMKFLHTLPAINTHEEESYEMFKTSKKNITLNLKNKFNVKNNNRRWVKAQAPDFRKIISREQLEKIYGDKRTIIPFSIPSFNQTWESTLFFYL